VLVKRPYNGIKSEVSLIKLPIFARFILSLGAYFFVSSFTNVVLSEPISEANQPNQQSLFVHFEQAVALIDHNLLTSQGALKADPKRLEMFVNQYILPLWDSQRTLKYLVGQKLWQSLSPQEVSALELRFQQTIQRYVREGMGLYDGQRVKTLRLQLNKAANRGLLTLRLEPIYLPSFNIQFKIAPASQPTDSEISQKLDSQKLAKPWLLYDILVEGISYIKLKKGQYRRIMENQGFNALLKQLDDKNEIVSGFHRQLTPQKAANAATSIYNRKANSLLVKEV